jgi:hypothetical protein
MSDEGRPFQEQVSNWLPLPKGLHHVRSFANVAHSPGCLVVTLPASLRAIESSVIALDIFRKSDAFDQFSVWYGRP